MSRRSVLPAAAGIGLAALLMSGCTPATTSSSEQDGRLRYLIEEQEDPEFLSTIEAHIDDFEEENPGITVEVEAMPFDTMRTVLQTQLQAGDAPDVFNWGSGPSFAGALAEAGLLYDLTDAYEEYDWPIYEFAKERVTVDGKLIGIPGDLETIGIYYNKQIFEDLGIDEPQNLGDLEAAAATILEAGIIPFAVSDQEGWQAGHLLSMTLSSKVGSEGIAALVEGEESWTSPDVLESLSLWKEWQDAGYLPEFPTSISYDSGAALYYSGEAAMLPTGSWFIPEVAANTEFESGYIPFPSEDGRGIFTAGLGSGPLVAANTDNAEAALTFVDFMVSEEHGRWAIENLGTIPPYPVDTEGVEALPLLKQVIEDTATFASGDADLGTNIDVVASDAFNQAMYDGFQGIFTGQQTPEDVAAALEAAARS
ncbi:ABC transporter substrate-binding protein [Naasia sp. SYSU D00948]|uniref:ABC transporter substrate-binding protein n=1 Tax=Naasia sp. SYSU D00948 TaxID=2817379 RepID=UPI001B312D1B|nr:extracellular solute-binding protein [Naasia sp. SYSU D00948]